jgi:hypothetical protein
MHPARGIGASRFVSSPRLAGMHPRRPFTRDIDAPHHAPHHAPPRTGFPIGWRCDVEPSARRENSSRTALRGVRAANTAFRRAAAPTPHHRERGKDGATRYQLPVAAPDPPQPPPRPPAAGAPLARGELLRLERLQRQRCGLARAHGKSAVRGRALRRPCREPGYRIRGARKALGKHVVEWREDATMLAPGCELHSR